MKFVQVRNIPSDRIKCIVNFNNNIVCGLHSGSLLIFPLNTGESEQEKTDKNIVKPSKTVQISKMALRGMATTTNLIVSSDDGHIHFLDNTFKRLRSLKVHNDFIRKVRTSEQFIFTCSDDFFIKKISNTNDEITVYQGHEHFVMDMQILDSERLISCSLDMTLKIWNYKTDLCISTLRGHTKGINALAVYGTTIYSVGDDNCIRIWQNNMTRTITGVSDKNLDHIFVDNDVIFTGGEDGHIRIYDISNETLKKDLSIGKRTWDTLTYENYLFVGSDTGLMIYKNEKIKIEHFCTTRGILTIKGKTAYINDKPVFTVPEGQINITSNNKMLCVQSENFYKVYSFLGYREKMSGYGQACFLFEPSLSENDSVKNEYLIVLKDNMIKIYHDLDEKFSFNVPFDQFRASFTHIVNYCDEGFSVYDFSGNILLQQEISITDCYVLDKHVVVLQNDLLKIMPLNFDEFNPAIEIQLTAPIKKGLVSQNVLYYQIGEKLYYLLPSGYNSCFSSHSGKLLGKDGDFLILEEKKSGSTDNITKITIDPMIKWQLSPKTNILPGRERECLVYLLSQKEEDLALKLFQNKFEVYLELNRYDDAFQHASSADEFAVLAVNYLKQSRFKKAARCYQKSEQFQLSELCQFLSNSKIGNQTIIGNISKISQNENAKDIDNLKEFIKQNEMFGLFEAYHG
ncbi:Vesicle coat complex COPI, beta' subunit [Pseudoloma neurophilia]|uniref:Vesicle coat complex COPI, beta' subunit n=1 Tax=Pseudoloma neurophilia TaxID=146866 RepID=A0A0R0M1N8_9MICR|nr:Vesicle coat complex COPI, beta' subunit [Pseudoloma neurophilia]